jgi:phosphate transport system substrate-binding protein
MLKFFDWSYRNGAKLADELQYVPMPKDVVQMIESAWAEVTDAHGQPAWMEPTTPSIELNWLSAVRART